MKQLIVARVLGLSLAAAAPAPGHARGIIENACLKADRRAASRPLCACIQAAADAVLSGSEQRRGAKFFDDPHMSQEIRASDRRADEKFWEKWKVFGATADKYCQ